MSVYETSPLKRRRRSKSEVEFLLNTTLNIIGEYDDPITIRHLFYRIVGVHVIEKTEAAYNSLCQHQASKGTSSGIASWQS